MKPTRGGGSSTLGIGGGAMIAARIFPGALNASKTDGVFGPCALPWGCCSGRNTDLEALRFQHEHSLGIFAGSLKFICFALHFLVPEAWYCGLCLVAASSTCGLVLALGGSKRDLSAA